MSQGDRAHRLEAATALGQELPLAPALVLGRLSGSLGLPEMEFRGLAV